MDGRCSEKMEFKSADKLSNYNHSEEALLSSSSDDLNLNKEMVSTESHTIETNEKETLSADVKDQRKDWSCSICGKGFRYPYTLLRHMPIHTKERKYKCDKCPKAFRQMSTLSQHKATHSSAKPYTCDACGKAFNRGSTLISHRRTHQDVKRFACSICRKAFHQKGNLVNHIYTHTNERPYRCDVCFRGFNQKSNLACHMFTLHGKKKTYSCDFCSANFSRENAFRVHINKCHRVGVMPYLENELLSTASPNLYLVPDETTNDEENTSYVEPLLSEQSQLRNCHSIVSTSRMSFDYNALHNMNLRVNVVKTPKKPALKIPALPIFKEEREGPIIMESNVAIDDIKTESQNGPSVFEMKSSHVVVADIIITDMGRNLVVREKPPLILEEVRSKGQIPYLLIVEPGQSPRLCKASLGTEGFIVSPVTNINLDRLSPSSGKFKIPIVMTIKRMFVGKEGLKTFIFIHKQPIQLSILQAQSDYIKCDASEDIQSYNEVNASPNEDLSEAGPLCIKMKHEHIPSKKRLIFESNVTKASSAMKKAGCPIDSTSFEHYSESENIIRLHLSQLVECETKNNIKTELVERNEASPKNL